jgi:hypothetical protein
VGNGLKFILNSLERVCNICVHNKIIKGLDAQKTLGMSSILARALNQFKLSPNHNTDGSKIENKLPIYFKK